MRMAQLAELEQAEAVGSARSQRLTSASHAPGASIENGNSLGQRPVVSTVLRKTAKRSSNAGCSFENHTPIDA